MLIPSLLAIQIHYTLIYIPKLTSNEILHVLFYLLFFIGKHVLFYLILFALVIFRFEICFSVV